MKWEPDLTMSCAIAEIKDILMGHGLAEPLASLICAEIGDAIGGQRVYVAVRPRSEYAERNAEIMGRFNGLNHRQLAADYDLTPRQVRRILKK